jgi:hypothetical protein
MANENCIICNRPFAIDANGKFVGRRHVQEWGALVHNNCASGNHDGIVPNDALLARLSAKGIEPDLNERGWIPVPAIS